MIANTHSIVVISILIWVRRYILFGVGGVLMVPLAQAQLTQTIIK